MSTKALTRKPKIRYTPFYRSESPSAAFVDVGNQTGWEIRLDAKNRLSLYRVEIQYHGIIEREWVATRVQWDRAPERICEVRKVLQGLLDVQKGRAK